MVDKRRFNRSVLELVKGDMTEMETEALVYYAESDLTLGAGFGTAIAARAGRSVQEELKNLDPVAMGGAVVTSAGEMKVKYIIHAVGPKFLEEDVEGKLRTTMVNTLKQAEEKGIKRILFPPMGTGFFGVPLDLCARVMVETIRGHLEGETTLEKVVICLLDYREYNVFKASLSALN